MILIRPSTEILHITPNALKNIELAGRCCYKSEGKTTEDSATQFVAMLLGRGHDSVLEHASATVRFICDRGVSHEIVRHRIASFCQESTRYCDYTGGHVQFIIPPWVSVDPGTYNTLPERVAGYTDDHAWLAATRSAEYAYKELRSLGWRPEQARAVLPNSLKTEVVMTANFREWRHFFTLRCAPAAHPQMREVAVPLHAHFAARFPEVFGDL
jgi:thymidylate synthase (FAD)